MKLSIQTIFAGLSESKAYNKNDNELSSDISIDVVGFLSTDALSFIPNFLFLFISIPDINQLILFKIVG